MSKDGFAEAVRAGLKSSDVAEHMSNGDFSDVAQLDLNEEERSLLQAAAKEVVDNSEVEGFLASRPPDKGGWGGKLSDPGFPNIQRATDYLNR